jgi:hypothetical protein
MTNSGSLAGSTDMEIHVTLKTIDNLRRRRSFKTLQGAIKFATKYVGEAPEVSTAFQYAVSGDGTAKITVVGATISDLFPKLKRESHDEFYGDEG